MSFRSDDNMAGKTGFSFGFAKKAEPKRHVAALATKKEDNREEIKGVDESGKLVLEKPKEGQGPPVIKCKNLLDGTLAPKKLAPNLSNGVKPKVLDKPLEELGGGIVSSTKLRQGITKLSNEDAEAMRELMKDAAREGTGEDVPGATAVPILMKAGTQKAREGAAPEATKEMYDNVSVESFGEAMLRGMGYDPNVHKVKPIFRDKLRDNLLGLGAKPLDPAEKMKISGKRKAAPPPKAKTVGAASGIAAAAADGDETNEAAAPSSGAAPVVDVDGATSTGPAQKRRRADGEDDSSKPGDPSSDIWASRGLVVKVIGKDARFKQFFGAEAVVLEVDEGQRCCRIKARPVGGDKSEQLKGVQLEDIETRVSRECKKVRVVRGPKKGSIAKLLKRDPARGVAVLSLEGADTEMSLDDVCQFME